jgi:class 3 adenylate cyclase
LEALAEPGGICVSSTVREQIAPSCPCHSPISESSRSKTSPSR